MDPREKEKLLRRESRLIEEMELEHIREFEAVVSGMDEASVPEWVWRSAIKASQARSRWYKDPTWRENKTLKRL
jgi:hypothetical protein